METKELKKENISTDNFVKRYSMQVEDIKKLKRYNTVFTESKKNGTASFVVEINPKLKLNVDFKTRQTLNFNEWSLIKTVYGMTSSFAKELPVRFVKGTGKTGNVYYMYELYVCKGVIYNGFIDDGTLKLAEALESLGYMDKLEFVSAGVSDDVEGTDVLSLF